MAPSSLTIIVADFQLPMLTLNAYKIAIHNAYTEHEYLLLSEKLLRYDKKKHTKCGVENNFKTMGL